MRQDFKTTVEVLRIHLLNAYHGSFLSNSFMRAALFSSRQKIIVVFATAHFVFLLFGMLPLKWREKMIFAPAFRLYERITNCHQVWNMFDTIPTINRLEARLIVQDKGRKAREEGVVLPGLQRFSQNEQVRLNKWMMGVVLDPTRSAFRESYMRNAAEALLRSGRYGPEAQLTLEVTPSYTRSLPGVRSLKEIAVKRPSVMGPFELGALVSRDTSAIPDP